MNDARRKKYMAIAERLRDLWSELQELADEERDAYDREAEIRA